MPIDQETIKDKLTMIGEYITELEPFLKYSNEDIVADKSKLRNVERLLQLIVDEAVDVNSHLIAELNLESPREYRGTFIILGKNGIMPAGFAEKISESVGLRNGIVHQYEKIDTGRMLNDIRNNIGDYTEYMRFVADFVEKKNSVRL
jgi:uncharacterized protein YutE (UPF0331/DUF86 family)